MLAEREKRVLACLDVDRMLQTLRDLLCIPSITGREANAQYWLAEQMKALQLEVDTWTIDVVGLQRHAAFPGMEVDRSQHAAIGLVGSWHGAHGTGKHLIFNGHIDVVPEGDVSQWSHDPWGAVREQDSIYGRGACDMKGGLIAALYAIKAISESGIELAGSLSLQSVIGEEDGGIGTFATLLRGHSGDAAIICEPTNLQIMPAQAGALTFQVRIPGRSAHACMRLEGVSAIEKYLDIHRELIVLEAERNHNIDHPLFSKLELPYPLSIGRVQGGNWSSSVPDEVIFEGRIGVAPGEDCQSVREQFHSRLQRLSDADPWLREHPLEIIWTGGQFESGEIPLDHPLVDCCTQSLYDLTGQDPAIAAMTAGTDLRLLVNQGKIPTVLCGPGDLRQAHVPDEHIHIGDLVRAAQAYILIAIRYLDA